MYDIELRLRGYQGEDSVHTAGLRAFWDTLSATKPGQFSQNFIPDVTATGQSATEMFAAIESGEVEIGYMASGYLSSRVASLRALDLPFIFKDHDAAFQLIDGDAGEVMRRDIGTMTGFRLLGMWDNGLRHITSRVGHVLRPGDGKGQKIRMIDTPIYRQTMDAIGFKPTPYDVRDLKAAVADGRLDAQENPLTNCHLFNVVNHQPFLSLTGHILGIVLLVANARWFDGLSPSVRRAVESAALTATQTQRLRAREEETRLRLVLEHAGAKFTRPGEVDRVALAHACRHIRNAAMRDLDPIIIKALG